MIHVLVLAIAAAFLSVVTVPTQPANAKIWKAIAVCESGSRWHLSNPPYSGGLEFLDSTWTSMDTERFAVTAGQATERQQMIVANRLLRVAGWQSWPVCSVKVGAR